MMCIQKNLTELDEHEKVVLKRIISKFRQWYASLTVRELARNQDLIREIKALETTINAALA